MDEHNEASAKARSLIWGAIYANGVNRTARTIGRKEQTLQAFKRGGGLSTETVVRLQALFPQIDEATWFRALRPGPPADLSRSSSKTEERAASNG